MRKTGGETLIFYEDIRLLLNRIVISLIFLSILLAIKLPHDVLDRYPTIRGITEYLIGIAPTIQAFIRRSSFPQVTEVYFSVMLILTPLWIKGLLPLVQRKKVTFWRVKVSESWGKTAAFCILLMVPATVFLVWLFYLSGLVINDSLFHRLSSSRSFLGLTGWVVYSALPVLSALETFSSLTELLRRKE